MDYTAGDYGHNSDEKTGDVYEKSDVNKAEVEDDGAKAARMAAELAKEEKEAERSAELKTHYNKKLVDYKRVRLRFALLLVCSVCGL